MRHKGVTILERHAEKAVVGVFGAAALGVIAIQFGRPTVVKVDNQSLSPDAAFARMTTKAKALEERLADKEAPEAVKSLQVPDVMESLRSKIGKGVAPSPRLPVALTLPVRGGIEGADASSAELPRVAPVAPPAPSKAVASAFGGTIDPLVVARTPGLERLVPIEQPFDKRAVSVEAVFPSAEMVRRLETDPDGEGPLRAPPPFWWKSRVEALDVILERREVAPDGKTGDTQVIAPMPGQPGFRDLLHGAEANLAEIVRMARERRRDVVQPGFYAMIAGEAWRRPEQAAGAAPAGAGANAAKVKELERRIESVAKEIETLKAQRDKQPERKNTPGKGSAPGGGGVGGGMVRAAPSAWGGFGGPLARQQKSGAAEPVDPERLAEDRRKALIDKRIKEREDEKAKLEAELAALAGVAPAPAPGKAPAVGGEVKPIESLEDLVVWAHDVTAEPGKVYQYRVRVAVTNPLFGNARQLHADSQAGAAEPVVISEPSDWSDPVGVGEDSRVYFTSAVAASGGAGPLGGPDSMSASVELWKFYYGFWRRAKATLKPGDALAATVELPKDFAKVWVVDGAGSAVTEEKALAERAPVDVGGFLLDVAPLALEGGAQGKSWQVVYRDGAGRVMVRSPETDTASHERRVMEASEQAAQKAALHKPGTGLAPTAAGDGAAATTPGTPPATPTGGNAPAPGTGRVRGGG